MDKELSMLKLLVLIAFVNRISCIIIFHHYFTQLGIWNRYISTNTTPLLNRDLNISTFLVTGHKYPLPILTVTKKYCNLVLKSLNSVDLYPVGLFDTQSEMKTEVIIPDHYKTHFKLLWYTQHQAPVNS